MTINKIRSSTQLNIDANLDMGTKKIVNLGAPGSDQDAATKKYVDDKPVGTGDVVGPATSTADHVAMFSDTTGKLIKDSGLALSGTNTGDQTITITGDAAGSGTTAIALAVNKTRLNVRNQTGVTIASTKAVYVSGFNNLPLIALATNITEVSHNVVGITVAPIAHQADGYIAVSGQCDAETNGWTVGTELYLSTAGALTATPPTSGAVRHVAIVTVQANYPNGKLLIYQYPEENYLAGGAGVNTIIRMGDSAGANKVSFRDYANAEVASLDSLGNFTAINPAGNKRTLTSNLTLADGACLVIAGYINLETYRLTLDGDARMEIL